MASVKIRKNSWLNFSDLLGFNGVEGTSGAVDETIQDYTFWETPEFPDVVPQDGDLFIDITDQNLGRLDLVAFDMYGDADLWWVIALANNIELIPTDMIIGTKLRIPARGFVDSLLAKGGQK
jgi:hypothetical protein